MLASRSIVRQEVSVWNRIQPITATSAWTKRPATLIRDSHAEGSTGLSMCSSRRHPDRLPPATTAGGAERARMTPSAQVIVSSADERRPGAAWAARRANGTLAVLPRLARHQPIVSFLAFDLGKLASAVADHPPGINDCLRPRSPGRSYPTRIFAQVLVSDLSKYQIHIRFLSIGSGFASRRGTGTGCPRAGRHVSPGEPAG